MRSIGLFLFCLALAGCAATTPSAPVAERSSAELFESADYVVVVATTGTDFLNHRNVHLIKYRRTSTIVFDRIFLDGFE